MKNLKSIFQPNKWTKIVISINAIIAFGALLFFLGLHSAVCTIDQVNEVHFINPNLIKPNTIIDYTVLATFENRLKDSLKQLKPPYSEKRLNGIIANLSGDGYWGKYFKVLSADSSGYKILVMHDIHPNLRDNFELITANSMYYLKPLKIVRDLKPGF